MQFLTRSEAREVNAKRNNPVRPLTSLEQLVKLLPATVVLESDKQKVRNEKQLQVESLHLHFKQLENQYQADRFIDAIGNPTKIEAVLSAYPHVEFEDVLTGTKPLNNLQLAALGGLTLQDIAKAGIWVLSLRTLIKRLPTHYKKAIDSFVGTPNTPYGELQHINKNTEGCHAMFYGLVLNPAMQKEVDELFNRRFAMDMDNHNLAISNAITYEILNWSPEEFKRRLRSYDVVVKMVDDLMGSVPTGQTWEPLTVEELKNVGRFIKVTVPIAIGDKLTESTYRFFI